MIFEPQFYGMQQAQQLFEQLYQELAWRQDDIFVYGRQITIPRLQAWYGDNQQAYTYSGLTLNALPWTSTLAQVKQAVEAYSGCSFNSCLANLYRDGNDSVSWHSDDEAELGINPVIASVSLGAKRDFQLKHKAQSEKLTVPLNSGSLLMMAGETQHYWQHCIAKSKRVKSPRINLTFRQIVVP
ncbi:alpha-ketoglutarate-dependent dioxygenase AlkB family protein [Thalassotalea euphylliae]